MTTITTTFQGKSIEVDINQWLEFVECDAWPGIEYWASELITGADGIEVVDEQNGGTHHTASWERIAEVTAALAADESYGSYQRRAFRDILVDWENVDYDADTWDAIIQTATLGRLIYG